MIDPQAVNLATLPWLPLSERSAFPRQPAIYFAINSNEEVQYIGISQDPKQRWSRHHRYEQLNSIGKVKIAYLFVEDVTLLRSIESALIAWFQPPLNISGNPANFVSANSNTPKLVNGIGKVMMQLPMTTFKQLTLWSWLEAQNCSQLCSNVVAAWAESNEEQFLADIESRAKDMGKTRDELIQEIFDAAGLDFTSNQIEIAPDDLD